MLFIGSFHPLLVHLPIGGLLVLVFLECIAALTRWKNAADSSRWILWFVFAGTLAAAACGWVLGGNGGYDAVLLNWHRILGCVLSAACLVTLVFRERERRRAYRFSLVGTLFLLTIVGHLGGTITHGRGFLTRHAPGLVRTMLASARIEPASPDATTINEEPVFSGVIHPILQKRCVSCHGPDKHKGELRLDSLEALLRGGVDGPCILQGKENHGLFLERVLSPLEADGHMPPDGNPQLAPEEIALLQWWINAGAPAEGRLRDMNLDPAIRSLLQLVSKRGDSSR